MQLPEVGSEGLPIWVGPDGVHTLLSSTDGIYSAPTLSFLPPPWHMPLFFLDYITLLYDHPPLSTCPSHWPAKFQPCLNPLPLPPPSDTSNTLQPLKQLLPAPLAQSHPLTEQRALHPWTSPKCPFDTAAGCPDGWK